MTSRWDEILLSPLGKDLEDDEQDQAKSKAMNMRLNPFDLFGLNPWNPSLSFKDLKKAWIKACLVLHPDKAKKWVHAVGWNIQMVNHIWSLFEGHSTAYNNYLFECMRQQWRRVHVSTWNPSVMDEIKTRSHLTEEEEAEIAGRLLSPIPDWEEGRDEDNARSARSARYTWVPAWRRPLCIEIEGSESQSRSVLNPDLTGDDFMWPIVNEYIMATNDPSSLERDDARLKPDMPLHRNPVHRLWHRLLARSRGKNDTAPSFNARQPTSEYRQQFDPEYLARLGIRLPPNGSPRTPNTARTLPQEKPYTPTPNNSSYTRRRRSPDGSRPATPFQAASRSNHDFNGRHRTMDDAIDLSDDEDDLPRATGHRAHPDPFTEDARPRASTYTFKSPSFTAESHTTNKSKKRTFEEPFVIDSEDDVDGDYVDSSDDQDAFRRRNNPRAKRPRKATTADDTSKQDNHTKPVVNTRKPWIACDAAVVEAPLRPTGWSYRQILDRRTVVDCLRGFIILTPPHPWAAIRNPVIQGERGILAIYVGITTADGQPTYASYDEEGQFNFSQQRAGRERHTTLISATDITFEGFFEGFQATSADHLDYLRWIIFSVQSFEHQQLLKDSKQKAN